MVGFVSAISLLGAAAGAWFAGPVSARVGRNRVMFLAGSLIVVGSVGAALTGSALLLGGSVSPTGWAWAERRRRRTGHAVRSGVPHAGAHVKRSRPAMDAHATSALQAAKRQTRSGLIGRSR
jgi:MFS family permease